MVTSPASQDSLGIPSLARGARLSRVGQTPISSLTDLPSHPVESRRVWIQATSPRSPVRHVSEESKESLRLWESLLLSGSPLRCLRLPPTFPVEAFADACAAEHAAGLGGFVRLSPGQCLYFQHHFEPAALLPLCPWLQEGQSLQLYICCWELLAQCALLLLLHQLLPQGHPSVHVLFRCDNATAEAASWKGFVNGSQGLCHVLRSFLRLQEWHKNRCVH